MAYTNYRGTKITGTSTTPTVFPKSGVPTAYKNETYFNTQTGHVYICTESGVKYSYYKSRDTYIKSFKQYYVYTNGSYQAVSSPKIEDLKKYYERKEIIGTADTAKWKYLRTDVIKKPSVAVTGLGAPVRGANGSHAMTVNWKTPAAMVDPKKGDRATALYMKWYLGIAGKDLKEASHTDNENVTTSSINLNNFKIGSKTYTRSSFYPFKNKPRLHYVTFAVQGYNVKGMGSKTAKATREFALPRKPSISAFSFNAETGTLSCTITTDVGNDYRERYDTRYKMTVYYSSTKKTYTIYDNSTTATSLSLSFDDKYYAGRAYGDYARVTVKAWSRGYKGPSEVVERTYYIAYPAKATIKKVSISDKTSAGKCTISIATNSTKAHPVDRVRLEILADVEYSTAAAIPAQAGWEQTDIVDDAQCKAMAVPVAELMPSRGNYTWIRLKTYHTNETVLYRYSDYYRIKALETPEATASDDKIKILSATAGEDGQSATISLAWNDGTPVSTGTELTWSKDEDAWKSTRAPETYTFTWSDGAKTVGGVQWPGSATISIKDLDENEKYYIKARRYLENDAGTTYSVYSNAATVITSEKPESVVATADRYVAKGSSLNVYWTFSGNSIQTMWQIVTSDDKVLASGQGSQGSAQIPPERLENLAVNGEIMFTVQVSTGSGYVVSEQKSVTIIDPPTLEITNDSLVLEDGKRTLQTNDLSIIFSSNKVCDLKIITTSQGAVGQFPQGVLRQTAGDTTHSGVYTPEWEAEYALTEDTELEDKRYYSYDSETQEYTAVIPESSSDNPSEEGWYEETGNLTATVDFPTALDFWDLGSYTVSCVAIDRQTNLFSEEKTLSFPVHWAHQAPSIEPTLVYTASEDDSVDDEKTYYSYDSEAQVYTVVIPEGDENPSEEGWYELSVTEYVTLTAIDEIDDGGFHHQAVQINLTPPSNAAETDVYDIYRVTGDGARLIGQGFPQTYVATDEYAPFGQDLTNYYRIAVRTEDGDVAFSDIEYVLEGDGIRVDWADGSVEYPYSVSIGDAYSKDVEIRKHIDGGISGYWNQGVERKSSLNTDAIKIIQQNDINLTRQLARYTGPAFVRTREGTAFEANVEITNLTTKNRAVMSIAIDANEIDLTEEFMLPTPFRLEEQESES